MAPSSKYCPTQSEFEAFPPTLKRKCFSTLERLRYAEVHAQADAQPRLDNIGKSLSRKLIASRSISRLRQSTYLSEQDQPVSMPSSHSGSAYTLANVTPEDALWFSQLPDKIKRGYFSLEEERLLNAKKEELILNATEENIYKLGQASNQSVPSLQNPSSCLSSIDDSTGYSIFTEDAEEDMDIELASTLNCLDAELDLSLDDYHLTLTDSRPPNADVARSSKSYKFQPSLAAGQSLSSSKIDGRAYQDSYTLHPSKSRKRRFTEWETPWVPNDLPPVPPVPETATIQRLHSRKASIVSVVNTSPRKTSGSSSSPRSSFKEDRSPVTTDENKSTSIWAPGPNKLLTPPMTPPLPLVESQAAHYLDPEARLKLRMYLASASKFDEALEFGFPSLPSPDTDDTISFRPVTASSSSHRSGTQQNLNRPATSTFRDCIIGVPLIASPISAYPVSPSQSEFFTVPYSSLSDNQPVATQERKTKVQAQLRKIDRDLHGCAAGREMTIRMTLTRPELRADESLLYPSMQDFSSYRPGTAFTSNDDSLGLQNLRLDDEAKLITSGNQRTTSIRRLWSRKQS